MKLKRFSGYSEAVPGGVTYQSGQVITKYILDPIDSGMNHIEKVDKYGVTKQKNKRIKRIVKPLKKYFKSFKKDK